MIVASSIIGVEMMDQGQRVLDVRGIPGEWKTSVIVPTIKGNEL